MSLLPAKAQPEGRLLVVAENGVEPIVISAVIGRESSEPVSRVFYDSFGLGGLAELPAFHGGRARTIVLGFPSPDLADEPQEVRRALQVALDLSWISTHSVDLPSDEAEGVRLTTAEGDLWPAVAKELGLPVGAVSSLEGIVGELPAALREPEEAGFDVGWRYAIEAARSEPFSLGASSRGLMDASAPDADLVSTGHAVVLEGRGLAVESSFHLFPVLGGQGVVVPAPRKAAGFYVDVARYARHSRGCLVSALFFDTQAPIIVEYSERPDDLLARIDLVQSRFPRHVVRPFGPSGFAVKGPEAGSLPVLEQLIEAMGAAIH